MAFFANRVTPHFSLRRADGNEPDAQVDAQGARGGPIGERRAKSLVSRLALLGSSEEKAPKMRSEKAVGCSVRCLAHIGLRIHDLERSRRIYEQLGFEWAWGPYGPEPVGAMRHPSGLELNFIVNARDAKTPNILMDVPEKYPGVTHIALKIDAVSATRAQLDAAGIAISGTRGDVALFIRDPDGNVLELASD
jgi:lactoylglutathione lyase